MGVVCVFLLRVYESLIFCTWPFNNVKNVIARVAFIYCLDIIHTGLIKKLM